MIPGIVAQRGGGGGSPPPVFWTPADTTSDIFLDPSDFSSMWQDSAKTTPVTATGQSVGYINDKSGNGHHFQQATADKRPTLQQDGSGAYYLDFDGSDDAMESVIAVDLSGGTAYSVFGAFYKEGASGDDLFLEHTTNFNNTIGALILYITSANRLNAIRRTATSPSSYQGYESATGQKDKMLVVSYASDTTLGTTLATEVPYLNINGTDSKSLAVAAFANTTGAGASATMYLGARAGTSLYLEGRVYGLTLLASVADTTARQRFEGYYAHLTGTEANLPGGHPYDSSPPTV